jgi:hypothetical protein
MTFKMNLFNEVVKLSKPPFDRVKFDTLSILRNSFEERYYPIS